LVACFLVRRGLRTSSLESDSKRFPVSIIVSDERNNLGLLHVACAILRTGGSLVVASGGSLVLTASMAESDSGSLDVSIIPNT